MSTTTQLQGYATREWGLILLIDGVDVAFTDHADLVGFATGTGHNVALGLKREGKIRMSVDLRESRFLDSPVEFHVVDFDGSLAGLFATIDETEEQLGDVPFGGGLRIMPGDSLAARTDLHGMNVGIERIGDAGERHLYPVPPGFDIGLQHEISHPEIDIIGAPVSAGPIVWAGRRVALYQVFRDVALYPSRATGSSSWRPFSEAQRRWVGTMRDSGMVEGREWTIECDGPESLLRKPLFASATAEPVRCTAIITLGPTETGMYIRLQDDSGTYGESNYATPIVGITAGEVRDEVRAEIAVVAAATGLMGIWNETDGYSVGMDDQARVSISVDQGSGQRGSLVMALHRKVWAMLGYDVVEQALFERKSDEPRYVSFVPADNGPDHDYWWADFFTGTSDLEAYPAGDDNDGASRTYVPLYQAGASALLANLNNGAGQLVYLGDAALGVDTSHGTVAHPGQLAVAPASDPEDSESYYQINGQDVDTAGYWLFFGKRRMAGTDEVIDEYWVGQASWVNGVAQQAGVVGADIIVVKQWLDPRLFGYDRKSPESDWAFRAQADDDEGGLRAVPIAMLGERPDKDLAHTVIQRLLYSTGTSTGWSAPEQAAVTVKDPGDNEPAGDRERPLDDEVADLGLAIPAEWIADPSDFLAAADRVEAKGILDVKCAFSAGYQSEDALRSLMQPVGWSWHFRDGRLGVWCPADSLTQGDVTVTLDRSVQIVKHSETGGPREIRQDIRRGQPIDRWKFDASWAPHLNKATHVFDRQSPDPHYRYRPGQVTQNVKAHAMRIKGTSDTGLTERIAYLAKFWARRHFEVRGYPVAPQQGEQLWPGSIVRITDPQLVDPNGANGYGVTNRIAIVTATEWRLGLDESRISVDLLVLATRSSTPKLHAPSARGVGYDTATDRLYVADNWLDVEGNWSDAALFVEPDYDGIVPFGGDALVRWWQWDGDTITNTGEGEVTGVSTTPGSSYLQLANVTGTYYRDMDTIVVMAAPQEGQQAAWVLALYAPICNDQGNYTDNAAATQPGDPWEP